MSKQGENIRKRSDGRWECRYSEKSTGKYKYFYGKTYREAKDKKYNYIADSASKPPSDRLPCLKPTFSQGFAEWLKYKRPHIKPSSYANYSNIIKKQLEPIFGKYAVDRMTADEINELVTQTYYSGNSNLSEKYVHDIVSVFRSTVSFLARKYGFPDISKEIVMRTADKRKINVLTEAEQKKLTAFLLDSGDLPAVGIVLCLYTGMRIGEICALKWSDIHTDEGYIDINKTLYRMKNLNEDDPKTIVVTGKPKTASSVRKIPISTYVSDILTHLEEYPKISYFLTGRENYMEPRTYQKIFKRCLRQAKISDCSFHVLRHTFATNCINSGCDIKSVSEILGHSSVKITLDKYVHPSMQTKKNQLDKLPVYR